MQNTVHYRHLLASFCSAFRRLHHSSLSPHLASSLVFPKQPEQIFAPFFGASLRAQLEFRTQISVWLTPAYSHSGFDLITPFCLLLWSKKQPQAYSIGRKECQWVTANKQGLWHLEKIFPVLWLCNYSQRVPCCYQ